MYSIKNEILFDWLSELDSTTDKENGLVKIIKNNNRKLTEANLVKIRQKLSRVFLPHVKNEMKRCNYRKLQFRKIHKNFLKNDFTVDFDIVDVGEKCSKNVSKSFVRQKTKSLSYLESSERGKQRRVKTISECYDLEELEKAVKKLKNVRTKSIGEELSNKKTKEIIVAKDVDLAAYMNGGFTKRIWTSTRRYNKAIGGSYLWPSYKRIRALKETCYPHKNFIKVTSFGASVDVQALFDHTAERIVSLIDEKKKKV